MKIIHFYEKYGEDATLVAFGASRKVISRWKQRLKKCGGSLSALIPYSTRPHKVRKSDVSFFIINFSRKLREKYPKIGKEKIKLLIDKYCSENNLKTIRKYTIYY